MTEPTLSAEHERACRYSGLDRTHATGADDCCCQPQLSADTVRPAGVWITAGWDMNWYDVRPWPNELEALRYINKDPYMGRQAYFIPFGEELHLKAGSCEHSDGEVCS